MLALDRIPGWSWTPAEDKLQRKLEILRDFVERHGWGAFRATTVIEGIAVGSWVHGCRVRQRRGELADGVCEALEAIPGWSWEPRTDIFGAWIESLRVRVRRAGWAGISIKARDGDDAALGRWVNRVRQLHRRGDLPAWVRGELEGIEGWSWDPHDDQHRRKLDLLRAFLARHGWDAFHWELELDGEQIGPWVNRCRTRQQRDDLPVWLCRDLAAIPGWRWR